jgi:hypothetical protein
MRDDSEAGTCLTRDLRIYNELSCPIAIHENQTIPSKPLGTSTWPAYCGVDLNPAKQWDRVAVQRMTP